MEALFIVFEAAALCGIFGKKKGVLRQCLPFLKTIGTRKYLLFCRARVWDALLLESFPSSRQVSYRGKVFCYRAMVRVALQVLLLRESCDDPYVVAVWIVLGKVTAAPPPTTCWGNSSV